MSDEVKEFDTVDNDSIFDENGNISVVDLDIEGDTFEFAYIPIEDIIVSKRIRQTHTVYALQKSIEETGLLEPIVVARAATKGTYVLIAGFRRLIACAKAGIKLIPSNINNKVKTTELTIIEALHNHSVEYSVSEIIAYIDYLEKEKNITNQSTVEYLCNLDSGDYPKLKDILNDNDPDIVDKLLNGDMTISEAFNKLQKKRKSMTKEEKEDKKVEDVYSNEKDEVVNMDSSGEVNEDNGQRLTDEEIAGLGIVPSEEDLSDKSLEQMIEDGSKIKGFEPKWQDRAAGDKIDPDLRKAIMARDDNKCQCCLDGGQSYVGVNEAHHLLPVYLGGTDKLENLECDCIKCHKMIHLYANGKLYIPPLDEISNEEKEKFKKIIARGTYIRKGIEKRGMRLEDFSKQDKVL